MEEGNRGWVVSKQWIIDSYNLNQRCDETQYLVGPAPTKPRLPVSKKSKSRSNSGLTRQLSQKKNNSKDSVSIPPDDARSSHSPKSSKTSLTLQLEDQDDVLTDPMEEEDYSHLRKMTKASSSTGSKKNGTNKESKMEVKSDSATEEEPLFRTFAKENNDSDTDSLADEMIQEKISDLFDTWK